MSGIAPGISPLFGRRVQSGLDPRTINLLSHFSTQPAPEITKLYNNFYLNHGTTIGLHKYLYINAAQYKDNAVINIASPGNFTKTETGIVELNKFVGLRATDNASRMNLGFVPSTDGMDKNNCCYWVWIESDWTQNAQIFGAANAMEHGSIRMTPHDFPPMTMVCSMDAWNTNGAPSVSAANFAGLWVMLYNGTHLKTYHNKILISSDAQASPYDVNCAITEFSQNIDNVQSSPYQKVIFAEGACPGTVDHEDLYDGLVEFRAALKVWPFYGDSRFCAYLLPAMEDGLPYKLAQLNNSDPWIQAIPSTTVTQFIASGRQIRPPTNAAEKLFFNWGLNDSAFGATWVPNYIADYQAAIDLAVACGVPKSQIVIISGQYQDLGPTFTAIYMLFVAAATQLAIDNGIKYVDISADVVDLLPDKLHTSALGATQEAALVQAQL